MLIKTKPKVLPYKFSIFLTITMYMFTYCLYIIVCPFTKIIMSVLMYMYLFSPEIYIVTTISVSFYLTPPPHQKKNYLMLLYIASPKSTCLLIQIIMSALMHLFYLLRVCVTTIYRFLLISTSPPPKNLL